MTYEPLHDAHGFIESSTRTGCSIFANWVVFYVILTLLLGVTTPAFHLSDNWSGILPAFCIMMFGAFRLARVGASTSTAFVYGCSTTLLFLIRFLSMGRFSLWLQYHAPSTEALAFMWIAICLFLGGAAAGTTYVSRDVASPASERPSRQV